MRPNSVALVVVAFLAGCAGSGPMGYNGGGGGGGGGGTSASVTIQDFFFGPSSVTIKAGGTVTWNNTGPSGHTVTSDAGAFNSGTLSPPMGDPYGGMTAGGTYQMTFPAPGTYAYHCAIHPTMHGTITVQ